MSTYFKPNKNNFQTVYKSQDGHCVFRPLNISRDLPEIFKWVNLPYSGKFWQLKGSYEFLRNTYQNILDNPFAHTFVGEFDHNLCCLFDLYAIPADEIHHHIPDSGYADCGLHLLMQPPRESQKGLSSVMLRSFIEFYFSFPESERLFAEPDVNNTHANRLALRAGFHLIKSVEMSYKTANLYCITKKMFYDTDKES